MSRTIIPKKKLKETFFTNISSENLIGRLCAHLGAKVHQSDLHYAADEVKYNNFMAYSMTKEEALDTAEKFEALLKNDAELKKVWNEIAKMHFHKDASEEELASFIESFVKFLKESEGYKCV